MIQLSLTNEAADKEGKDTFTEWTLYRSSTGERWEVTVLYRVTLTLNSSGTVSLGVGIPIKASILTMMMIEINTEKSLTFVRIWNMT